MPHTTSDQIIRRDTAPLASRSLRLLGEAGKVIGTSLDYETTLAALANLVVPEFSDWCAIDLVDEAAGEIRRVSVVHSDPKRIELAHELRRRKPPRLTDPTGLAQVIRSGQTAWVAEVPEEAVLKAAQDPEHARLLLALQLRSYICVPLSARGRVFGALTVVNSESNRIYTHDDVALAEELGRRAGVAVDHARLFDAARRSEERFRLATEAASTFAWECQLQTGGIEWSENAAKVIGCAPAELPTDMRQASFFIAPEDRERIHRQNSDALEKGLTGFKFEFRGVGEPTVAKRWESQGQIIYDDAGKPLRSIGITQDVSERVKAQERLKQAVEEHVRDEAAVRAAHQRTISVLNLMSDCYIEMDSDWRLTFVNAAAARFNGCNCLAA